MKRAKSKGTSLTLLGRSETKLPSSPAEARLETFPNPTRRNYHIHFETDDFTCLCPVTGQPDIASMRIAYRGAQIDRPGLLRYLVSYRRHPGFHEHCVERIFVDILSRCRCERLALYGRFTRRGGIDINPFRTNAAVATPLNVRTARQ